MASPLYVYVLKCPCSHGLENGFPQKEQWQPRVWVIIYMDRVAGDLQSFTNYGHFPLSGLDFDSAYVWPNYLLLIGLGLVFTLVILMAYSCVIWLTLGGNGAANLAHCLYHSNMTSHHVVEYNLWSFLDFCNFWQGNSIISQGSINMIIHSAPIWNVAPTLHEGFGRNQLKHATNLLQY